MAKMVSFMLCIFHHTQKKCDSCFGSKNGREETYTLFLGGKKGCVSVGFF